MKNKRSFFMGVGCGLILSSLILILFSVFPFGQEQTPGNSTSQGQVQPDSRNEDTSHNNSDLGEQNQSNSDSAEQKIKEIEIKKGSTASEIAQQLFAAELISNKDQFLEEVYQRNASGDFKAGHYQVPVGLSTQKVIELLVQ